MSPEVKNKPTVDLLNRITSLFQSQNIKYQIIEHEEIDGSAAGSSAISGTKPEQGAKALVMITNGEGPVLVVLRGPDKASWGAVKKATHSSDVRMASLEEIQTLTASEAGILPPIGSLFGINTYFDQMLADEEEIAFGTGSKTKTVIMKATDFIRATKPIIGEFSKKTE